MQVLHAIDDLAQTSGGPSRSSTQLASAMGPHQCNNRFFVFRRDLLEVPVDKSISIFSVESKRRKSIYQALAILDSDTPIDLVHIHGIWSPFLHYVSSWCRANKVPYIISSRGMLEEWSLKQRWLKKKFAMLLYQRYDLEHAAKIHVTADLERRSLEKLGFRHNVTIPNGVELPSFTSERNQNRHQEVLFLSRIHPKKGVDVLLHAWREIDRRDWKLKIVGPADKEYLTQLVKLTQILKIQDSVQFLPAVDDRLKWKYYRDASLFALPSHSENFGIVVAEALAAETPVITTSGTPWRDLLTHKCGWCIDLSVDLLAEVLRNAIHLTPVERREMGLRGRNYVERNYSWDAVARKMIDCYRSAARVSLNRS